MLQTDDVDEDYFTPSNNATLANIFSNSSNKNYDNSSLKYVPPKPTVSSATKSEDSKTSECTFACSLEAFEWLNNVYTPRGKVGFAILKMTKVGCSNILLYDSNKSTLSCATVQPSFELKVKGDTYLSYYDNARRYWSLLGTSDDIQEILKFLRNLNCVIGLSPLEDQPEPAQAEEKKAVQPTEDILRESDTDSSTNRKTKLSILNRMASMGQSILPPQTIMAEKTSDSSDTNDTYEHHKVTRHKASKSVFKKALEKGATDVTRISVSKIEPENSSHSSSSDKQLLPIMTTDIISSVSAAQDVNVLMAEQRQSNSELRINIGRLTDKMDQLLEKVNDIKQNEIPADFQTTIYKKLLSEYEKKIKAYEELIKSKEFDINTSNTTQAYKNLSESKVHDEIEKLEAQLLCLHNTNKQKDIQIQNILSEKELLITQLSEKNDKTRKQLEQDKISQAKRFQFNLTNQKDAEVMTYKAIYEQEKLDLLKHIEELKLELSNKKIELDNCKITCDKLNEARKGSGQKTVLDLEMKVKSIMNDTFQSIAANFDSDENYLGSVVKNTTAAVIKEVTLETLKALKSDF